METLVGLCTLLFVGWGIASFSASTPDHYTGRPPYPLPRWALLGLTCNLTALTALFLWACYLAAPFIGRLVLELFR